MTNNLNLSVNPRSIGTLVPRLKFSRRVKPVTPAYQPASAHRRGIERAVFDSTSAGRKMLAESPLGLFV